MRISLLENNLEVITTVATWIYNEWLKPNPEASLEKTIAMLTPRINSTQMPLTLIAFDDQGIPVGTASLTQLDMKSHPELTPWLGGVYVTPSARGQGISSKLCKEIESHAKALGYSKIYLFTKDQREMYEHLGWRMMFTEDYHQMFVSVMEKELS